MAESNDSESSPIRALNSPEEDPLIAERMLNVRPAVETIDDPVTGGIGSSVDGTRGSGLPSRYLDPQRIAAGGMGELWRFRDAQLDRDVVVKRPRPDAAGRFGGAADFDHEAKLQASLGHPGIVSVFDLGADAAGHPYFTMQEVRGSTLADVLDHPPTVPNRAAWSRRAHLEVLARVSLTVAFAHKRGVLHLDLKPENIMLGDFGEVYVLDWGISRHKDHVVEPGGPPFVGTLQYMSPEQARQEPPDERADVFALGAILFEVLMDEMLRRGGGQRELFALACQDPRAIDRLSGSNVPFELALLCSQATAFAKEDRTPTALAFHAALEAWLDGERDMGRRREVAEKCMSAARAAREAGEPLPAVMRHLSRAVSFDPDHTDAVKLLSAMMIEAAQAVPDGAKAALAKEAEAAGRRSALFGVLTYAAWFGLLPLALLVGVRSYGALSLIVVPALGAMLVSAAALRNGWSNAKLSAAIVLSFLCISGFATAFGPLLVVPSLVTANLMPLLHLSSNRRPFPTLILVCAMLGLVVPIALEWAGVVPPSYEWRDGAMVIIPRLIDLPPVGSSVILLVGALLNLLSCHFTVSTSVQQQLRSRTEALAQAHVLQELMPEALRALVPQDAEVEFVRPSLPDVRPPAANPGNP